MAVYMQMQSLQKWCYQQHYFQLLHLRWLPLILLSPSGLLSWLSGALYNQPPLIFTQMFEAGCIPIPPIFNLIKASINWYVVKTRFWVQFLNLVFECHSKWYPPRKRFWYLHNYFQEATHCFCQGCELFESSYVVECFDVFRKLCTAPALPKEAQRPRDNFN